MRGRIAGQFGHRYSGLGGFDRFHQDRPEDAQRLRELASGDIRVVAPIIEASVLARLRERLPHSKTVGHLNSIATLLEGMQMGAGGVPIDTKRDVDFLRDLAAALASLPDEGEQ